MEENFLENIRSFIISEQARTIVRDYNANKSKLETNYNIGKELVEAGKHYGEGIIKTYSEKLTNEFGKGYDVSELKRMRKFHLLFQKGGAVPHQLTWSHISKLLPLTDMNEINYYISVTIRDNLSYRKLAERIKSDEYDRLPLETKIKLKEELTEKVLENLIIDNISYVMKQLGEGYCFIDNQYKINIGNNKNYIDILLFNIKYNNYVVIELKVREFRKEDIGQILLYMNYIDKEVKSITHNKTMGIIITKEVDKFVVRYVNHDNIAISSINLIREEVRE